MKFSLKTVRLAALFTALALSLTSCGFIVWNDPDARVTTDAPETTVPVTSASPVTTDAPETEPEVDLRTEADKRLEELPGRSFSATNILLATCDPLAVAPMEDDGTETVTARRIAAHEVEKKYSTRIISVSYTPSELLAEAKEAHAAGMYFADLLVVPIDRVGELNAAGLLANMNSLPFADYTKEWYNEKITEESRLGDEIKAVYGSASLDPTRISCIYFNRELAKQLGVDLYALVNDGAWTYDKLLELTAAANAAEGVNGFTAGYDRDELIRRSAESMNLDYVTTYKGELPTLDFMKDGALSTLAAGIVEKLYALIYQQSPSFDVGDEVKFAGGELLFLADELSYITSLTDVKAKWGILPMPKFSESQPTYISPLSNEASVFCAVSSTPDYEKPGLILEALNVSAHDYVLDVYYNEMINRHLRDGGSIPMLELVVESVSSDFTQIFASGINQLENATYGAIVSAVTTSASLDTATARYASAAESALASSTVIRK